MKLIIIGGGCAGLSCAEEIRRIENKDENLQIDENVKITLFQMEEFCSRPAVFSPLKSFMQEPMAALMGLKHEQYYSEKHNIQLQRQKIAQINSHEQHVITENGEVHSYDKLLIATGGKPRWGNFNKTTSVNQIQENENHQHVKNIQATLPYSNQLSPHASEVMEGSVTGMLVVRNPEEINAVRDYVIDQYHQRVASGISTPDDFYDVVVIGTGALGLDMASNMLTGLKNAVDPPPAPKKKMGKFKRRNQISKEKNTDNDNNNGNNGNNNNNNREDDESNKHPIREPWDREKTPRMALLGRGSLIGTRMLSTPAAEVLTKNAKHQADESGGVFELILEEQIDHLEYSSVTHRVTDIVLQSGRRLPCGIAVLAIGVDANTQLARDSGLSVDNGITVDRHMECRGASEEIPSHSIYSAGDCTEIPDLLASFVSQRFVSAVWKNWASAREEGVAAARSILGVENKEPVVFNHTLRLFDMYLGGIGCFKTSVENQSQLVVKEQSHDTDYTKLIFLTRENNNAHLLVGGEVIGPTAKDFRKASGIVRITKMLKWIPTSVATPDDMIDKGFNWTKLWKNLKENNDIESADNILADYIESAI